MQVLPAYLKEIKPHINRGKLITIIYSSRFKWATPLMKK